MGNHPSTKNKHDVLDDDIIQDVRIVVDEVCCFACSCELVVLLYLLLYTVTIHRLQKIVPKTS